MSFLKHWKPEPNEKDIQTYSARILEFTELQTHLGPFHTESQASTDKHQLSVTQVGLRWSQ